MASAGAKKSLQDFIKNLTNAVNISASNKNMRLIGERAIQLIVTRTQKGLGVISPGAAEMPLRALSQNYIDYRRNQSKQLDSTTRPGTSNLTFTGAMLRSMTIKSVSNGAVTVGPSNQVRKGGATNAQIADYLEATRPFNNLSRSEINTVVEFVDSILQLEIVKI